MSWINITDIIYPIGSYYISNNNTPPAELFGGTWTQLTGRFLYATTSTSTGGSNTHTLTVNQIPSHAHNIYSGYGDAGNPTVSNDAYRYQFWVVILEVGTAETQVPLRWEEALRTITCQHIKVVIVGIEQLRRI